MLTSMYEGSPLSFADSGAVKFGNLADLDENTILDIPAGIILGVFSGLLGALFIYVNVNVNIIRKRYINTNVKKII
jgi:H+/Cl- antiporter ClcA